MKKLFLFLLVGSGGLMVWAQTNPPVAAPASREVGLRSDSLFYSGSDLRQLVYAGNVRVTNSQGSLTCGWLTLDLPPENVTDSRPTNVVALTNVVINYVKDGKTNHITCDKMVNAYSVLNGVTNDTFTFTGNAKMQNDRGWMTGEPLIYDNLSGRFSGSGIESHFSMPSNPGSGTNTGSQATPLNIFK